MRYTSRAAYVFSLRVMLLAKGSIPVAGRKLTVAAVGRLNAGRGRPEPEEVAST
jgi:hypothetical protein